MKVKKIHMLEFTDYWLSQDQKIAQETLDLTFNITPSEMFSTSQSEMEVFFGKKKMSMAKFYTYQRKKLNLLMDHGAPIGGKFSFDTENRKKLPKKIEIKEKYTPKENSFVKEAKEYIDKHFKDSLGDLDTFYYPSTFSEAKIALKDFIDHRLLQFGDYEDAISKTDSFLFHSVLSPLLNIGLLTPKLVVNEVIKAFEKEDLPLNSIEGFIRQIIGWREYMRSAYLLHGNFERTHNFFNHKKDLPKGFWDASTGIEPVDEALKKLLKTGYCHHIERLMIFGNFLLLTETNPDKVYEWFMAMFVDSYDWVMVPNVYGMSQYADEGLMTTKPYVSGSNYLLKMSNFYKGSWCDIWDGLFWRFLDKHRPLFQKNPRMSVLIKYLDNNKDTLASKVKQAELWMKKHCS
jgi:deoxyribodipyrimidine photolyase-related protein